MMARMMPAPGMKARAMVLTASSMMRRLIQALTVSLNTVTSSPAMPLSCSQAAIGPSLISVATSGKLLSRPLTTGSGMSLSAMMRALMCCQLMPMSWKTTLRMPCRFHEEGSFTPSSEPVSQLNTASPRWTRKCSLKLRNPSIAAPTRFFTNLIGPVKIALSTAVPLSMMLSMVPSDMPNLLSAQVKNFFAAHSSSLPSLASAPDIASFIFSIFWSMALIAAVCLSFSFACSSFSLPATVLSSSASLSFISPAAFLPMSFSPGSRPSTYSWIFFFASASSSLHSWITRLLSAAICSTSRSMVETNSARLVSKIALTRGSLSMPSSQSFAFLAQPNQPE